MPMIKLRDDLECLQGLEASFLAIIGEAVGAGWTNRLVLRSFGEPLDR